MSASLLFESTELTLDLTLFLASSDDALLSTPLSLSSSSLSLNKGVEALRFRACFLILSFGGCARLAGFVELRCTAVEGRLDCENAGLATLWVGTETETFLMTGLLLGADPKKFMVLADCWF